MDRDEARRRLQALATVGDGWYTLRFEDDDRFTVRDECGCSADGLLTEQWVHLETQRPLSQMLRRGLPDGIGASLLRVQIADQGAVLAQGRLYLDGFSLQAFITLARDLLVFAGPASAQATPGAALAQPSADRVSVGTPEPAPREDHSDIQRDPSEADEQSGDGIAELAPGAGAGAPAVALEASARASDEDVASPLELDAFEEGPSEIDEGSVELTDKTSGSKSTAAAPERHADAAARPKEGEPASAAGSSGAAPAEGAHAPEGQEPVRQEEVSAGTPLSADAGGKTPLIRLTPEDFPAGPSGDETLIYDANPFLPSRPMDAGAAVSPVAIFAEPNPSAPQWSAPVAGALPGDLAASNELEQNEGASGVDSSVAHPPVLGGLAPTPPSMRAPEAGPGGAPDHEHDEKEFDPTLTNDRLPSSVGATIQLSRSALGGRSLPREEVSPPSPPAAHTCPRCSATVQPGERFCIRCGAPQPGETAGPLARSADPPARTGPDPGGGASAGSGREAPGMVACPRCGYQNPARNRFCQGCGSALAP